MNMTKEKRAEETIDWGSKMLADKIAIESLHGNMLAAAIKGAMRAAYKMGLEVAAEVAATTETD